MVMVTGSKTNFLFFFAQTIICVDLPKRGHNNADILVFSGGNQDAAYAMFS